MFPFHSSSTSGPVASGGSWSITPKSLCDGARHVAFQRTGRIQCHADDNEQAGTTQLDGNAGQIADDHRHSRNDCQEHSADQSDLAQGLGDEIAGRLARTNAGMVPLFLRSWLLMSTGLYWIAT